ncbi:MAG: two-component system response regulator [Phycisphaerales bacterium]
MAQRLGTALKGRRLTPDSSAAMAKRKPKHDASDTPALPTGGRASPPTGEPAPTRPPSRPRTKRKPGATLPDATHPSAQRQPINVLVVESDARRATESTAALAAGIGARCTIAIGTDDAQRLLSDEPFDAVLIDADIPNSRGVELALSILGAKGEPRTEPAANEAPRVILLASDPGFDLSLRAMRAGVCDLLKKPVQPAALNESVRRAAEQARSARAQERRVQRLKRLCRRLNTAREEVTQQVGGLCEELFNAYEDLAGQMEQVTMATEFSSLIRQELDVESLLRTTLEFLLTKTGPTNAAVFLPTGPREYSLGAYVNYDIPRETADVLLDHLADTLPQRFEDESTVLLSTTSRELAEWTQEGAAWIADSHSLVFACRSHDECLAVATLFRDPSRPFTPEVIAQIEIMRDLFTQQLSRVINLHNRHKPKHAWPGFADPADEDQDYGLAA